jgi:hypothetical protein
MYSERNYIYFSVLRWVRPFGISRLRWDDNIRMDLREMGWKGVD